MPRLFLSAGDTSGDQHAARMLRKLQQRVPELRAEGLGGPELAAAGMTLHHDLVAGAIMGIGPALAAVPQLLGLLRKVASHFDRARPDRVVLVDYPGLNLQIARLAKRRGIPVSYFVAPQLWAWAPWRARRFARAVDEALVIFPFEVPFFARAGLPATFIGHPLLDALPREDCARPEITARARPVALLPGSRRREVRDNMPLLLDAAERLAARRPELSFHTAHVSPEQRARIEDMARGRPIDFTLHDDDVHGVMASCHCAAVASGTATLETGMLGTPLVVFYRVSSFEARVGPQLLVPRHIGQVNLLSARELTPELYLQQHDPDALAAALEPLLDDGPAWQAQRDGLAALRAAQLGGPSAVERAAEHLAAHFTGGAAQRPSSRAPTSTSPR